MVTVERATEIALSLPDTTSAPHFDRTAFRVPRRIFATLGASARDVNLRLDPELQTAVVEARPRAFAQIAGGWGRQGWTRCDLDAVTEVDLDRVLREAHTLATTPPPPRPRTSAKTKATRAAPTTQRKRSAR